MAGKPEGECYWWGQETPVDAGNMHHKRVSQLPFRNIVETTKSQSSTNPETLAANAVHASLTSVTPWTPVVGALKHSLPKQAMRKATELCKMVAQVAQARASW